MKSSDPVHQDSRRADRPVHNGYSPGFSITPALYFMWMWSVQRKAAGLHYSDQTIKPGSTDQTFSKTLTLAVEQASESKNEEQPIQWTEVKLLIISYRNHAQGPEQPVVWCIQMLCLRIRCVCISHSVTDRCCLHLLSWRLLIPNPEDQMDNMLWAL